MKPFWGNFLKWPPKMNGSMEQSVSDSRMGRFTKLPTKFFSLGAYILPDGISLRLINMLKFYMIGERRGGEQVLVLQILIYRQYVYMRVEIQILPRSEK